MFYNNIYFIKSNLYSLLNIYSKKINNVGINNLYYPFIFDSKKNLQKVLGLWNLNIKLEKFKRGAHMSRFISIIDKYKKIPLNIKSFFNIYKPFVDKLESNSVNIQVTFNFFIKKFAPISKKSSLMNYKISLLIKKINIYIDFILKLIIPVNNLCPCSKFISKYNAHNQRSNVILILKLKKKFDDIYKLINLIESQSSTQLWSNLKRIDEKYLTEFSYINPKFVEDYTRNIALKLKNINNIRYYIIKVENYESIHNHNVFSIIKN